MTKKYLTCIIILSFLSILALPAIAMQPSTIPNDRMAWGIILKKDLMFKDVDFVDNSSPDNTTWYDFSIINCTVAGIGRHYITTELDYTIYAYTNDSEQPYTGTLCNNATIYLLDFQQRPIMKEKVQFQTDTFPAFYMYKTGTFSGRLFIDGKLVMEKNHSYTHH